MRESEGVELGGVVGVGAWVGNFGTAALMS